jgi:hypothetical protein
VTGPNFVVDIRRHRGNSNYVIELVNRYCSGLSGANPKWLVRPDQSHLLPPDHLIGEADPSDRSWTGRISEIVVQSARNAQNGDAGGPFWVLSYDNYLLTEIRKINSESMPITTVHIAPAPRPRGRHLWYCTSGCSR